jgi:hypothetical protein
MKLLSLPLIAMDIQERTVEMALFYLLSVMLTMPESCAKIPLQ